MLCVPGIYDARRYQAAQEEANPPPAKRPKGSASQSIAGQLRRCTECGQHHVPSGGAGVCSFCKVRASSCRCSSHWCVCPQSCQQQQQLQPFNCWAAAAVHRVRPASRAQRGCLSLQLLQGAHMFLHSLSSWCVCSQSCQQQQQLQPAKCWAAAAMHRVQSTPCALRRCWSLQLHLALCFSLVCVNYVSSSSSSSASQSIAGQLQRCTECGQHHVPSTGAETCSSCKVCTSSYCCLSH